MKDFRLSIQVSPPQLLAEGLENSLDTLAECGLDAIHLNTHSYYGLVVNRGGEVPVTWANDHRPDRIYAGVWERAWVEHTPELFSDVGLFHAGPDADDPTLGWDVFAKITALAEERGIAVHGRYLDGWSDARTKGIAGWKDVLVKSLDGETLPIPCFSNPRVQEWWRLTAGETAARYPKLKSLFYGIERGSTFHDVVFGKNQKPYCFCSHCMDRAKNYGIDPNRAKSGYEALFSLASRARSGEPVRDGYWTEIWRHILRFPEVMVWDKLERDGLDEMANIGYRAVKQARPDCGYGQIAHQSMDHYRAAIEDWGCIRGNADYTVLRIYAHIIGPRFVKGIEDTQNKSLTGSLPEIARLAMGWNALHPETLSMPAKDELFENGDPAELQGEVLRRCHSALNSEMPVYAGFGVDISYPLESRRETPENYIQQTLESLQQNELAGVVACREYCETSKVSLKAIHKFLK